MFVFKALLKWTWPIYLAIFAAMDPAPAQSVADAQHKRLAPLPGKVIGIVIANATPELTTQGRKVPQDTIGFASGFGGYRLVYLPCAENKEAKSGPDALDAVRLPVGNGERKAFAHVCLGTRADLNRLGIRDPYALVEVDVNGGLGSSESADAFAVTGPLHRLDGTEAYPLEVSDKVHGLRRQYDKSLEEQKDAINRALDKVAHSALGSRPLSGPRETHQHIFVT